MRTLHKSCTVTWLGLCVTSQLCQSFIHLWLSQVTSCALQSPLLCGSSSSDCWPCLKWLNYLYTVAKPELWPCPYRLSDYVIFFLKRYSPNLGLGLPPWNSPFHFGFLDLRHSVGLLGRVISSSQGLHLHTNTEKRARTHTHTKHPCPEWDSNPRSRFPSERRQYMP
jgi:hypothetical protein